MLLTGKRLILLVAALSSAGFNKVERIRALQDVLAAMGIGASDRNSNRYSLAIFDEPSFFSVFTVHE